MKSEVNLSDCVGKTISGYAFSSAIGHCVIAFTDDTFANLGIEHGYDLSDAEIQEKKFEMFDFGDEDLVFAGVATENEIAIARALRDAESRRKAVEYQEERDKKELARLRAKYGPDWCT